MSNILYDKTIKKHICPYFQLPQRIVTDGLLALLKDCELRLYTFLFYKGQKHSAVELDRLSNAEIRQYTGLSDSSIRAARAGLAAYGLIATEPMGNRGHKWLILNPVTGEPLPNPRTGSVSATTMVTTTTMASNVVALPARVLHDGAQVQTTVRTLPAVNLGELPRSDYERYYRRVLVGQQGKRAGDGYLFCCPFHGDANASLKVNLQTGVWYCFGCQKSGGMVAFEAELAGCAKQEAFMRVCEVIGKPFIRSRQTREPIDVYDYMDDHGELLYQKLKYADEERKYSVRAWVEGKWVASLDGVRRVLYRLPELVAANTVFFTEGEKDANRLARELLSVFPERDESFAVTTNCEGASSWREEYARCFWAKRVWILPDNDDAGRRHALRVAQSVVSYAAEVKIVYLPGLALKGDVSDFLEAHDILELLQIVDAAPVFTPDSEQLHATNFITQGVKF